MIKTEVREVPASSLTVDPAVQRPVDQRRVKKLADHWDDLMVGVLTVSHRLPSFVGDSKPEQLVILDGQTRWQAFMTVCGTPDTTGTLLCQVHTGLNIKEEAKIFLEHNDRKGVNPLDTFRLSLVAEEKWAVDVATIAAKYRWAVSGTGDPKQRKFQAVGAAKKIYVTDGTGQALDRTFAVIDAAWPREAGTVMGETLSGIGTLIAEHGDLDLASLVRKLSVMGLNKYYSSVRDTYRTYTSWSLAHAAYVRTVEIYNSGRRTRRIEI